MHRCFVDVLLKIYAIRFEALQILLYEIFDDHKSILICFDD